MVELNLEEQVRRIEQETGIRSESTQSASEAEAAKAAQAKGGRVFDRNSLGQEMPELIEVTEPVELQNYKPVYFRCRRGDYCHFYFQLDQPGVVKIDTWPLDD